MSENLNSQTYLAKKRREKWLAWFFMILGGLILLDSGTPIPFPLVGLPSILVGGGLLGFGYTQYQSYRKLPLHEALQLGKQLGGHLTRTDLFLHFHKINVDD